MKKLTSILATLSIFVMSICFPVSIYAIETDQANQVLASEGLVLTEISEFTELQEYKKMTNAELKSLQFTEEEIEELRTFSYEEALLERARLSDAELQAIGYTYDEIKLLREYDGTPLNANSPVLAATAVCTGSMHFYSYDESTSELMFYYYFNWDKQPVCQYDDRIAVSYAAINPNSINISVSATYKAANIYYYSTATGNYFKTESLSVRPISTFDGYYADYPCTQVVSEQSDGTMFLWAKQGFLWLKLKPDGSNSINLVKAFGSVGHKQLSFSSTSIGFSQTPGTSDYSISFSFTPTTKIKSVAIANYTIKSNGISSSN